jgi:hypothetical protein
MKAGKVIDPTGNVIVEIHPLRERADDLAQADRSAAFARYPRRWDFPLNAMAVIQRAIECSEAVAAELLRTMISDGRIPVRGPWDTEPSIAEYTSAIFRTDGSVYFPGSSMQVPWIEVDLDEVLAVLNVQPPETAVSSIRGDNQRSTTPARQMGQSAAVFRADGTDGTTADRNDEASIRRYSQAALEEWYVKRVQTWPESVRHPSECDDVAAAKSEVGQGVTRDAVRKLRKTLAPPDWRAHGRRRT